MKKNKRKSFLTIKNGGSLADFQLYLGTNIPKHIGIELEYKECFGRHGRRLLNAGDFDPECHLCNAKDEQIREAKAAFEALAEDAAEQQNSFGDWQRDHYLRVDTLAVANDSYLRILQPDLEQFKGLLEAKPQGIPGQVSFNSAKEPYVFGDTRDDDVNNNRPPDFYKWPLRGFSVDQNSVSLEYRYDRRPELRACVTLNNFNFLHLKFRVPRPNGQPPVVYDIIMDKLISGIIFPNRCQSIVRIIENRDGIITENGYHHFFTQKRVSCH